MKIMRPITDDGLVGYDDNNRLILCTLVSDGMQFTFIKDVRRETCIICNHGWQETGPSMGDQIRWDLTRSYVHKTCSIRHEGLREREEINSAVRAAKIQFDGLIPIPNGYWAAPDLWAAKPWYELELSKFPVKLVVGVRKSVINIEVRAQGGVDLDWWEAAEEAFKDEKVTKEFSRKLVLLHAYGTAKMQQYVKQIADVAGYADKE